MKPIYVIVDLLAIVLLIATGVANIHKSTDIAYLSFVVTALMIEKTARDTKE
jgi:hypothetical protein